MEESSRLDRKIAGDKALSNMETLWEAFYVAMQRVAAKLNAQYDRGVSVKRNDHNSLIQANSAPRIVNNDTEIKRELEIRFDRDADKVTVIIVDSGGLIRAHKPPSTRSKPLTYQIIPNADGSELLFSSGKGEPLTAEALAEHLLAERLLDMKLPP